jgi:methylated-DNA-[protein]-cysteine S-methyltransferase
MKIWMTTFASPLGPLLLMSNGELLVGVHTDTDKHRPAIQPDWIFDDTVAPFAQTIAQLRAYFDGNLTEFSLPLAAQGSTFQMIVWRELRNIPYGKTISYAELARRIARPTAARAVGHANARNPISIIVPCHRVIGADHSLTGYAGGLDRKQALLALESRTLGQCPGPTAAHGDREQVPRQPSFF